MCRSVGSRIRFETGGGNVFIIFIKFCLVYIIIITKLVAVIVMLVFIYIILIPSSPVFLQLMLSWCFALAIDLCLQGKTEESI